MGLITEGFPGDEYNAEARETSLRFRPEMTEDEVAQLTHAVFVEYMEIDPVGFKNECYKRAGEIRSLLLQKSE